MEFEALCQVIGTEYEDSVCLKKPLTSCRGRCQSGILKVNTELEDRVLGVESREARNLQGT